ncbi:GTPase Der [Trichonephila clavata]|uniref:GTPase Der n=1 Tax=Trichonephila clavata TaxID=2740835 RepID=A0A8X6G1I5_TRICU|nr:GTPase Der [Trichonephila clavata]
MVDLYDALASVIENISANSPPFGVIPVLDTGIQKKNSMDPSVKHWDDNKSSNESGKLRISIIGRPNVGKSTFLNSLLTENRLITSSEPGTTRDSVDIVYDHNGELITLIDTAGIRRKANVIDDLESRFVEKKLRINQALSCGSFNARLPSWY